MDTLEIKNKILNMLFEKYLNNPSALVDISPTVITSGADIKVVLNYLLENKWIRDFSSIGTKCLVKITIEGIREVHPAFTRNHIGSILKTLANSAGKRSVMEVLKLQPFYFPMAHDLVKFAENANLLESSLYLENDIFVKLTSYAKELYEKNKNKF